jgi:phenylacetate-CoA ligase
MKAHISYGYGLFTGGLGAHYGAEELGCAVIPMSGGQTEKQIQLIDEFKPEIIMVTPSYMLALLDGFRARGLDPRKSSLQVGIFGAEPWTVEMRDEIETAFDLKAVDIYGLSEVMGPGVAQEYAATQDGLTLWEDYFYPEIIDPDSGAVLPDGEEGELVLTSLAKQASPVIRYRTRDITRLLPGSNGPMRRIAKITGRSDDMLIIRGVNVFPSQIEVEILKCAQLAPHYLVTVWRDGPMDALTLKVESRTALDQAACHAQAQVLQKLLKTFIGVSAQVEIVAPDSLPRSQGKAVRVDDQRG